MRIKTIHNIRNIFNTSGYTIKSKRVPLTKEKLIFYRESFRRIFIYACLSVIIGGLVGIVDAIFGQGLLYLNELRHNHPYYFIPFLGLGGIFIMWLYINYGGRANRGMGLVFDVGYEEDNSIPLRMIPLTIIGTWITHLFGGSAGREGVAVQIGATISMHFSKYLPKGEHQRILLLSGMAAGFAGLFETPMAGTFFALEVLVVGSIFYEALVPAIIAAWVAAFTSGSLGLHSIHMPMIAVPQMTVQYLFLTIAAGICFGIVGKLFFTLLLKLRILFARWFPNPMWRIGILGSILAIIFLLLDQGRYSGLSDEIFMATFTNGTIYQWDWIFKLLLTTITLTAGFQGGELTPCFVIGSSLGYILGGLLGVPTHLLAACGCAAVFGSATNTLLAPIFVGVEIFGAQALPYFFIACVTAYVTAGHDSIYVGQKQLTELLDYRLQPIRHEAIDRDENNKEERKEEKYE